MAQVNIRGGWIGAELHAQRLARSCRLLKLRTQLALGLDYDVYASVAA